LRIFTDDRAPQFPAREPKTLFSGSALHLASATPLASSFEDALDTANESASHFRTNEAGSSSSGARSVVQCIFAPSSCQADFRSRAKNIFKFPQSAKGHIP
jgi:hypothetical protein